MKKLTLAFIALIFISCSDNGAGVDNFEGQRIGNWLTTSTTTAKWVGNSIQSKMKKGKSDTTFFSAPNGNNLTLRFGRERQGKDIFVVTYIDSSYSFSTFDDTEASTDIHFMNPFDKTDFGGVIGASTEMMKVSITVSTFSCDSTYSIDPADDFEFHILNDSGGIYESIIVDTDGVEQTVRQLGC